WQPEFTDKTLSRKTGAVHSRKECFRKVPAISEIINVQPGLRC
ncbi:phage N-6-adenine-methyltransferase, partial [Shigella boydii]